jgi:hypothetical protein
MNIYLLKENIDFKEIINERMKKKWKRGRVRISFREIIPNIKLKCFIHLWFVVGLR